MWNPSRFFLLVPLLVVSGRDVGPLPMALISFPVDPEGGRASEISFAPRVDRVAYRLDCLGGRAGIWVMDRGTGSHRQVLPDVADERYHVLSLSPSGAHLAYTRMSVDQTPRLIGIGVLEGASESRREMDGAAVAWAPRGDRVAVADPSVSTISILDVPSFETRTVLRTPCASDPDGRPLLSWSPKGDRLAYVIHQPLAPMTSLWTDSADGGDARLVMADGEGCVSLLPFWSPDGRLAWRLTSGNDPSGTRHYLQEANGEVHELGQGVRLDPAGLPSWSPDDSAIVFPRTPSDDEGGGTSTDLWALAPASGDLRRLTDTGDAFGEVAWSPSGGTLYLTDGQRIRSLELREP